MSDLLERAAELAEMEALLDRAMGGNGGTIVLEGPAGIGKSALLACAVEQAATRGMRVLRARATWLGTQVGFGTARELFADVLASEEEPARAAGRLLAGDAPGGEDTEAGAHALWWLTAQLAERGPVAVVVDDAHWADRPSLHALAVLADRAQDLPLAVIAALRPEEQGAPAHLLTALRSAPGSALLTPAPLSAAAVGQLVRNELPGAEAGFAAECARLTAGSPLLATQLIDTVRRDGLAPTETGASRLEELVPASVKQGVLARLTRLPAEQAGLARVAAVLGDGLPLRLLAPAAELEAVAAERAADALTAAGILQPGEPVWFAHPLVATAIRREVPERTRARWHARYAELLRASGSGTEEIAVHLLEASPGAVAGARETLERAASRALDRGDWQAAERFLSRAREQQPAPLTPATDLKLILAKGALGSGPARDAAEQAVAGLTDPDARVEALAALARAHFIQADFTAAAEAIEQALRLTPAGHPLREELSAELVAAAMQKEDPADRDRERAADVMGDLAAGRLRPSPALLALQAALSAGGGAATEDIAAIAQRAGAGIDLDDPIGATMAVGFTGFALLWTDQLDAADALALPALEGSLGSGSLVLFVTAAFVLASSSLQRGRLEDAVSYARHPLAQRRHGWASYVGWSSAVSSIASLERGDLAAARTALATGEQAGGQGPHRAPVLFARARVALAKDRPERALPDLLEAGRVLARNGLDHPGILAWQPEAARAAWHAGDEETAAREAGTALERARAVGTPRALGAALRSAALVHGGAHGVALLEEAVAVLAQSPCELEHAHALNDLGMALRRRGSPAAAREPLRRALALAETLGSAPLAGQAHAELRAAGGRRGTRPPAEGRDALTPSEQRVVELAAQGLTNAQIAGRLYLTVKTVEWHLTRSYRKLGVSSRRALADRLAAAGAR